MVDVPAEILFRVFLFFFCFCFSAGGPCKQIWHGHICPVFDVVHPAFPLPTTASSIPQDALKDGLGEAVVTSPIVKDDKAEGGGGNKTEIGRPLRQAKATLFKLTVRSAQF